MVNLKEAIGQARVKENCNDAIESKKFVKKMIEFIDELSDIDLSFLEIEVLQVIVDYKWITFTKQFFIWQFLFLILFLASFIADLVLESDTFKIAENK